MRYDGDQAGAGLAWDEADLDLAVHRELRDLVVAEGERLTAWRHEERHDRYVNEGAVAVENRGELDEADGAVNDRYAGLIDCSRNTNRATAGQRRQQHKQEQNPCGAQQLLT